MLLKRKINRIGLQFQIDGNDYLYTMPQEKKNDKKERSKKYAEKLKINTSLDDVLKVSVPKKKK